MERIRFLDSWNEEYPSDGIEHIPIDKCSENTMKQIDDVIKLIENLPISIILKDG